MKATTAIKKAWNKATQLKRRHAVWSEFYGQMDMYRLILLALFVRRRDERDKSFSLSLSQINFNFRLMIWCIEKWEIDLSEADTLTDCRHCCVCVFMIVGRWHSSRFPLHIRINFSRSKARIAFQTNTLKRSKICGALHSFINTQQTGKRYRNRWIQWKRNETNRMAYALCILCVLRSSSCFSCKNVLPISLSCQTTVISPNRHWKWRFWKKNHFKSFWKNVLQNESETVFSQKQKRNSHANDNKNDDLITWRWHDYYKPNTQRWQS